jgi:hypothetical protein
MVAKGDSYSRSYRHITTDGNPSRKGFESHAFTITISPDGYPVIL